MTPWHFLKTASVTHRWNKMMMNVHLMNHPLVDKEKLKEFHYKTLDFREYRKLYGYDEPE